MKQFAENNGKYEVLTPTGWKSFDGVSRQTKTSLETIELTLTDGSWLRCSSGHQVVARVGAETSEQGDVPVCVLHESDQVLTVNGWSDIVSIKQGAGNESVDLFDLVNVDGGLRYITNGIASHNCAHIQNMEEVWTAMTPTLSCLSGDTLVQTSEGFIRIDEFHKGRREGEYFDIDDVLVYGSNGLEPVSKGYVSPKSKLLTVTTQKGHQVKVTKNHPLWTLEPHGSGYASMKKSADLVAGDYLRIEFGQNIFGSVSLSPDEAYMLGGYTAEGWFTKANRSGTVVYTGIAIENTDTDFRNVFLNSQIIKPFRVEKNRHSRLVCTSTKLVERFIANGVDPTAKCHEKQIPKAVLQGNKETMCNYLAGLFDGDGSVSGTSVILSSTSKRLIQEVSLLLHNLGVQTNIHYVKPRLCQIGRIMPQGKPLQSLRDSWKLVVTQTQLPAFSKCITLRIPRKQSKILSLCKSLRGTTQVAVPYVCIGKQVKDFIDESGKSYRWFRKNGARLDKPFKKSGSHGFTHGLLSTLGTLLTNVPSAHDFLQTHQQGNFYWDKIVSIEESFVDEVSYDFTVPGTHTFLQNGILGSNTGGQAVLISCVTPDTHVLTNTGIRQVSDFVQQTNGQIGAHVLPPYTVQGIDKSRTGVLFFANGEAPVFKVTSKYSEIKCSSEHKFWAWSNEKGYAVHRTQDLTTDSWIAIRKNTRLWGVDTSTNGYVYKPSGRKVKRTYTDTGTITTDLAYFVGLYLAEGSCYKSYKDGKHTGSSLTITCGDPEARTEMLKLNGLHVSSTGIRHTISSKQFVDFLEKVGLDTTQKANTKRIPQKFMSMPEEHTVALLQGLFDGDGFSRIDRGYIGYTSVSEELVNQVRVLLCNLGILTTKYTNKNKFNFDSYVLEADGTNSLLFYDRIGFRFARKQAKRQILSTQNLNRVSGHDVIPGGAKLAKELAVSKGLSVFDCKKQYRKATGIEAQWLMPREHKSPNVGRKSLLKFVNWLQPDEDYSRIVNDDIVWTQVSKIEYVGTQPVYDFSLPNNDVEGDFAHSVLYNSGISGFQSPNGVGNVFHRVWVDAVNGQNSFTPFELPWTVHPERDQKWFETESAKIRAGKGERGVAQEFFCSFNASGDTFIDGEIVMFYESVATDPVFKHQDYPDLWIWKQPEAGHTYIIPADVARGNGEDFTTFHVIDVTTDEIVAEYCRKIPPDDFAPILLKIGAWYNTGMLCPELNSYGAEVAKLLKKAQYPNLYYEKANKGVYSAWMTPTNSTFDDDLPGFTMGPKSREMAMAKLEGVLRKKNLKINSKRLISELKTFIWRNNKAQAMKGYHDDLIMALAIGVTLFESSGRVQYTQQEISTAMLAGMSVNNTKMSATIADWGFSTTNSSNNPHQTQKPIVPTPLNSNQRVRQDQRNPFWRQWGWLLD